LLYVRAYIRPHPVSGVASESSFWKVGAGRSSMMAR